MPSPHPPLHTTKSVLHHTRFPFSLSDSESNGGAMAVMADQYIMVAIAVMADQYLTVAIAVMADHQIFTRSSSARYIPQPSGMLNFS
jgi:hypothetical protein